MLILNGGVDERLGPVYLCLERQRRTLERCRQPYRRINVETMSREYEKYY